MNHADTAIVLFDGLCNLCSASVQFVIDRDGRRLFRFASLQSAIGQQLLARHHLDPLAIRSVVLIDRGRAYTRSDAALRIARGLGGVWRLLGLVGCTIPAPIRDAVYNWIARNRYRWFGQQTQCRLPSPELAGRFLDQEPFPR